MIIAVIDNVPIYRIGTCFLLKSEFPQSVVIESDNLRDLRHSHPLKKFALIVLSIESLPETQIEPTIYNLKNAYPAARIVVVGKNLQQDGILHYLSIGIEGYVSNLAGDNEFTTCVTDVNSGKKYINTDTLLRLLNISDGTNRTYEQSEKALSKRECEIAKYLSDGKKNSWIANELNLKASTISTTKATIFKKLFVDDIIQLRSKIQKLGLC